MGERETAADVEVRIPLEDLVAGLSDPAFHGAAEPAVVLQTHISVVVLAGSRAYKVKKPLRLWGLLDYGTVEGRRRCCEEEVRLNRRLAPDLYLGVAPVTRERGGRLALGGAGEVVEHAVVMERIPAGITFAERLVAGTLGEAEVCDAARALAAFHAQNRLPPGQRRLGRPSAFGAILRQNVRATAESVPDLFPSRVHAALARRLARGLAARRGLVRRRLAAGRMVDGHGDVRLEHVMRRGARIEVFDCVEFTPRLRHVDPLSDLAFLSMDLAVRGRGDLATVLEAGYVSAAGEDEGEARALLPLYRAYRAHVRAKVDAQTHRSPGVCAAERAARALGACRHLALAWTWARCGERPPLILLHGLPGAGKSVLASTLAPWLDAAILRSDEIRKELAGVGPTERVEGAARDRLYSGGVSERTYAVVLERALAIAAGGRAAILDATYVRASDRAVARAAARVAGLPFVVLAVCCPEGEVRARLRGREAGGRDASDAGVEVYLRLQGEMEPLTAEERGVGVVYQAGEAPEGVVLPLLERVEEQEA